MTNLKQSSQSGAVSLFVVIFTTLLITVITVSFVQLMIKGQQQASDSDLSQSAYDSAMAGVEDAKRALLIDHLCNNNDADCVKIQSALSSEKCNSLAKAGVAGEEDGTETQIQKQGGAADGNALNQAYTCVTVTMNTPDYKTQLAANASRLIPLKGVSNFNEVKVTWFTREDAAGGTPLADGGVPPAVTFPAPATGPVALPPVGTQWAAPTTPAMLRFQLIQYGKTFQLSDFDKAEGGGGSFKTDASTVFLYPTTAGNSTITSMSTYDTHFSSSAAINAPAPVTCSNTFGVNTYACSVTITLPGPLTSGKRQAYLWLSTLYNQAHVQLQLYQDSTPVDFDGVQPEIDSTGRANDLFRRVKARVELKPADLPYPQAAVDIEGNLCKSFFITDASSDYQSACTP